MKVVREYGSRVWARRGTDAIQFPIKIQIIHSIIEYAILSIKNPPMGLILNYLCNRNENYVKVNIAKKNKV